MKQLNFTNRYQQLGQAFYKEQLPTPVENPYLIHINKLMLNELDSNYNTIDKNLFTELSSGNAVFESCEPCAFIYAGHQFGHFNPQLGDGRAILLGEIENEKGNYWELQLKGAGLTPYSRNGDGRAVLRSTIREYLCSEAMAALDIPTTRSLSVVGSEEEVFRETLETGSIMIRMAPSFIRFGSFELFASRGQFSEVKQLADFVIKHYFPDIDLKDKLANPYQEWLENIVDSTAELMAKWQAAGFAHGVMNTDNMSILGLTLDYGPFGFLDNYDSQFICNHSDPQGRYRFDRQPYIGFWNLNCLAKSLLSLMSEEQAKDILSEYETKYQQYYLNLMAQKLGLFDLDSSNIDKSKTENLVDRLLNIMETQKVDYSLFLRRLADFNFDKNLKQANSELLDLFDQPNAFKLWSAEYAEILDNQTSLSTNQRKVKMNQVNPKYILRNYIAQMVIEAVEEKQDFDFLDQWIKVLQSPYDEHPEVEQFSGLPPEWANKISVSCSS